MKKFKTTWMFAILVVALGLYAYFGEYRREKKEAEEKEITTRIVEAPKDTIQKIIIHQGSEDLILEKAGDVFKITSPLQDATDPAVMDAYLDGLTTEKYIEVAKEGGTISWKDDGLDQPIGVITISDTSGKKTVIAVSAKRNFEGNSLIRRNDENRVLVATSAWIDKASRKPSGFRDRRLYRGSTAKLDSIELKNPLGILKLQKKDGNWADVSENHYELDQNRVREIMVGLTETKAEDFLLARPPSKAERSQYFLTKPLIEIRLKASGQSWLGELGEGSARESYAFTSDPLFVLQLPKGSLDKFRNIDVLDLRERTSAFRFQPDNVAEMKWSNELKTTTLKKENDKWVLAPADEKFVVDQAKASDGIERLKKTVVLNYLSAGDQKKFKPTHSLELLDTQKHTVFKAEWSGLTKVKIGIQDKNLILVKTSAHPEVFAMDEEWMNKLNLLDILLAKDDAAASAKGKPASEGH